MNSGVVIYKRKRRIKKLCEKYGEQIMHDFKKIQDGRPYCTLASLGIKYGFSRERARQIFFELVGKGAREIKKQPISELTCKHDPRHKLAEFNEHGKQFLGAQKEKLFFDECLKRGFNISTNCKRTIDFDVNGYKVEVKSRTGVTFQRGNVTGIVQFNARKNQIEKADFFACWHPVEKCFFIIPQKAIKGRYSIAILEKPSNYRCAKNRYWEFKNAWHLLSNNEQEAPLPQIQKAINAIR